MMTGLRAGRLSNVGSITSRGNISVLQKVQTLSVVHSRPMLWLPDAFSSGVHRSGREADQCPLASAEVKNVLT